MSSLIFPTYLLGQKFTSRKAPQWNTGVQRALSGKTSRLSYQQYPRYAFELEYEFLSNAHPLLPSRANFVTWSQDATQWQLSASGTGFNPVVVGNWSQAPDGSLTADRVIMNRDGGTGMSQIYTATAIASLIGSAITSSVWLKTNDGSTVTVVLFFDGRITPTTSGVYCTVTPTWQRFSASGTPISPGGYCGLRIDSALGSTSSYADLSVWGAQLETGGLASTNIQTYGAQVRNADLRTLFGLFNRMAGQGDTFLYQDPDFQTVQQQQFATGNASTTSFNLTAAFQPGSESSQFGAILGLASAAEWIQNTNGAPLIYTQRYGAPELLGSASRTNLVLQSNFAATWTTTAGTITANAATSPDGTTDAANFTEGSTTAIYAAELVQTSLITASERFVCSVWLKYVGRQYVSVTVDDNSSSNNAVWCAFDLLNGVAGTPTVGSAAFASAADVQMIAFPNGWYRCSVALQNAASVTTVRLGIASAPSLTPTFYQTVAGINAVAFQMFGAQIEAGTRPTALIPVTTAHVTATADYSLSSLTTSGPVNTFQQIVFANAPANGVVLSWSGSFFYRCRFSDDSIDFQDDMYRLWSLKRLSFEQVYL